MCSTMSAGGSDGGRHSVKEAIRIYELCPDSILHGVALDGMGGTSEFLLVTA